LRVHLVTPSNRSLTTFVWSPHVVYASRVVYELLLAAGASRAPGQRAARDLGPQGIATTATQHEVARRYQAAYPLYLSSASSLLYLTRVAPDAASKAKAQRLASRCLDRAAKLKAADPSLLSRQGALATSEIEVDALLAKSERLEWTSAEQPSLSPAQLEAGATYRRHPWSGDDVRAEDVQQAGVTDCSVVAGLAACAAHQLAHGSKVRASA
jgi:hypothetical protein